MTLTDILGAEDAFGDMDFKVAGTADAVTALQLDTKIDGLPADVLAKALHQAKDGPPRDPDVITDCDRRAPQRGRRGRRPKIVSMEIPIDKIGEVIGPKGKVINTLQQETGADIAVDDDGVVGTVTIGAKDGHAVEEARRRIALILDPPTAEVGAVYQGKVVNIDQVRRLREHPPGPRRPAAHLEDVAARRWQAHRPGRGRPRARSGASRCSVDDIDPQGKVSLSLAGERRWPVERSSSAAQSAPSAAASVPSAGGRSAPPPSRTPSRPSWPPSSATSVPARRCRARATAAAVATGAGGRRR